MDFRAQTSDMVGALCELVMCESPSSDVKAVGDCAARVDELATDLVGFGPERVPVGGWMHLRWRRSAPTRVLLLGHLDTVWPLGTTQRWPFDVRDGIATGPGAFDMKAGLVQGLFALHALGFPDGVELLVTSDEELGSPTSRALIEDAARDTQAVLVLEPSADGALKTARKGVSGYTITAHGKAAHAGLEPEKGHNALVELAHQVLALQGIARDTTTVTPTVAKAGTAVNVVPARAELHVDVRVWSKDEQERVDRAMKELHAVSDGVSLEVSGEKNRPPLSSSASAELFERAQRVAKALDLGPLSGAEVGGASDGNFTAGIGVPTLDGLGAVGGGAHAEGEHVVVDKMAERAALVAALVTDLLEED